MTSLEPVHIPVMPAEVRSLLRPGPGQVYLDATAGLGGHASLMAGALAPGGTVILNDVDPGNLEKATARVRKAEPGVTVRAIRGNFALLPHQMIGQGVRADLVLADLGFSSNQVEDGGRGFSFSRPGPLDMRLDPTLPVSATELVASLPEAELARLISEYGEDRDARQIARRIVRARAESPIRTTEALAAAVRGARRTGGGIDPATRTFQALRIAVNDELGSLDALLAGVLREAALASCGEATTWLAPGARVAFITFHSLEDRAVKRAFGEAVELGAERVGEAHVEPTEAERKANPRSRSAKLRCIRLGG